MFRHHETTLGVGMLIKTNVSEESNEVGSIGINTFLSDQERERERGGGGVIVPTQPLSIAGPVLCQCN